MNVIVARLVNAQKLDQTIESLNIVLRFLKPLLRLLDKLLLEPLTSLCARELFAKLLKLVQLRFEVVLGFDEPSSPVLAALDHALLGSDLDVVVHVFEALLKIVPFDDELALFREELAKFGADEFKNALLLDESGLEVWDVLGVDVRCGSTSVDAVEHTALVIAY